MIAHVKVVLCCYFKVKHNLTQPVALNV